jgi:hypothetical protein
VRHRLLALAIAMSAVLAVGLAPTARAATSTRQVFHFSGGIGTYAATQDLACMNMPPPQSGIYGYWATRGHQVTAKARVTVHRFHIGIHGAIEVTFAPIDDSYPTYTGRVRFADHTIVPNAYQTIFVPYVATLTGTDGSHADISNAVQFITEKDRGVVGIGGNNGFACAA